MEWLYLVIGIAVVAVVVVLGGIAATICPSENTRPEVALTTAGGPVSGKFFIDDTVVTFVPDNLLQYGTDHTINVTAAMTDEPTISGNRFSKSIYSSWCFSSPGRY